VAASATPPAAAGLRTGMILSVYGGMGDFAQAAGATRCRDAGWVRSVGQ